MFRKIGCLTALILISYYSFSQESDFQTWANAELSGELFNKIDFEVVPEIRLSNNSTFVKAVLTDFDLSYKVADFLRFGLQYRVQQKNYIENLSYMVNRFGIYARTDFKIDKFRFNYRFIYQQEYEGYNHQEYSNIPFLEHRHRIAVSYYKKSWALRPAISYELFLQVKPNFLAEEFTSRLSAGLNYNVTKKFGVYLGYKLQKEYFENNPLTSHILAVGVSYKLN
jgi:predicted porin